jgi:hypothetical protein
MYKCIYYLRSFTNILTVLSFQNLMLNPFFLCRFFQRKMLAVYLHHDASVLTNVFCTQVNIP